MRSLLRASLQLLPCTNTATPQHQSCAVPLRRACADRTPRHDERTTRALPRRTKPWSARTAVPSKVIVPDKWKDGARNVTGGSDGGRATTYRNSLLQVRGATQRFQAGVKTCRICKSKVSQDANYCQECAHHNGICAMCGKRVDDLRFDRRGGVKPEKRKEPQGFVESDYGTAERFRKKAKAPEESEEAPPPVPAEDPEVVARRERDARAQASALGAADATPIERGTASSARNRRRPRRAGAGGAGRGAAAPAGWVRRRARRSAYGDWQSAGRDVGRSLLQRKNAAGVDLAARRRAPRRRPSSKKDPVTRSPPAPRRRRSPTAWRCGTGAGVAKMLPQSRATAIGGATSAAGSRRDGTRGLLTPPTICAERSSSSIALLGSMYSAGRCCLARGRPQTKTTANDAIFNMIHVILSSKPQRKMPCISDVNRLPCTSVSEHDSGAPPRRRKHGKTRRRPPRPRRARRTGTAPVAERERAPKRHDPRGPRSPVAPRPARERP